MNNNTPKRLNTFLVDDEQYSIDLLTQELKKLKQINIIGSETNYHKALKTIKQQKPDLLFLDVEMPCKSGFELLEELRNSVSFSFHVIFYTGYDKYAIQALRQSAFDFILKPVQTNELKEAIERLSEQRKQTGLKNKPTNKLYPPPGDIITLPTYTGIRFLKCNEVIYAQYKKERGINKGSWYIGLYDFSELRLRNGINAGRIMELLGEVQFVQINQSAIVNLNYINTIEIKTRQCIMLPPFEKLNLSISRNLMGNIRERFEVV